MWQGSAGAGADKGHSELPATHKESLNPHLKPNHTRSRESGAADSPAELFGAANQPPQRRKAERDDQQDRFEPMSYTCSGPREPMSRRNVLQGTEFRGHPSRKLILGKWPQMNSCHGATRSPALGAAAKDVVCQNREWKHEAWDKHFSS